MSETESATSVAPAPEEEAAPRGTRSSSHRVILDAFRESPSFRALGRRIPGPGEAVAVGGLAGSSRAAVLAGLHEAEPGRILVAVTSDPAEATALEADLESLLGEGVPRLYPQRETLPYEAEEHHLEIGGLRVEAVEALFGRRTRLLVTPARALQERAPIPTGLATLRTTVSVGDTVRLGTLSERLEARGFEKVPVVEEVGQYAIRGGIVDIFSFGSPDPFRLELWGDEVASIRYFDILDQRSTREVDEAHVLPVDFRREADEGSRNRSLLELIPRRSLLVGFEPLDLERAAERTWEEVLDLHRAEERRGRTPEPPEEIFLEPEALAEKIRELGRVGLHADDEGEILFDTLPAETVDRDTDRLREILRAGAARGEDTLVLCDNPGQLERLEEILGGVDAIPPGTRLAVNSVGQGFLLREREPTLRVLTDHQIFRRSRRLRRGRRFRGAVSLESLARLRPGDYVVHMDHGVGVFRTLDRIEVGGEEVEALALEYADGDVLRVPVHRLDLVERWVGESDDADPPTVHRIGGKSWKRLKERTEQSIERMAVELLQLYAERETADGHAFSPDTRWQREMESAFLYEDTPDQRKVSRDVKRDMESPTPMDRLICGDVGYGKTEVAVRAAFKAVQDSKQVAVLTPTTILSEQHLHTFEERLADYPVRIRALSRFRTRKTQREILDGVAGGEVDIVIGTHRLLSPDVEFHDLGLVVVDEEQRFGVKHKERLKRLKTSVDVLTLTATPIPRTLQLSLAKLRDLSLIRTPPRDRQPIITHVLRWSGEIIREAIQRELDRGGQVFFLHNRVETIDTAARKVERLAPEARIAVAHGQLPGAELDEVMRGFIDGEVDILVCSSIIENGIDVPNANTLIVDRADRFGLAQLYQIRGRVGRSDRRAYCYLLTPEGVTEEARKRLRVLEHYTELGSGYSVALRDLELRGAGNLLGADQSGFAHAVGLDTYLRLLEKTIERLKRAGEEEEFPLPDVTVEGAAYLPEEYVPDGSQKLHLYRRISKMERPEEAEAIRRELDDRFGSPPPEVVRLLESSRLRLLGKELGISRILVRGKEVRLNFRLEADPRVTLMESAFEGQQLEVEIRRIEPLSLKLHHRGPEPTTETLIRGLTRLVEEEERVA